MVLPTKQPVDKTFHSPQQIGEYLILVDMWHIKQIKNLVLHNSYKQSNNWAQKLIKLVTFLSLKNLRGLMGNG